MQKGGKKDKSSMLKMFNNSRNAWYEIIETLGERKKIKFEGTTSLQIICMSCKMT